MSIQQCPKCSETKIVKSGVINDRQRFQCKSCNYYFTVDKIGKKIDEYYVIKALQLYLEGLSFREIERIIGVSHVSVSNWVKAYGIKKPPTSKYHPTYKVLKQEELSEYFKNPNHVYGKGMIITELGDKFMLIKWERFKE